ncbi:MAG: hypothetical protein Q7T87_14945 [Polaromonas sp.]|nr:hypothetical protein [Polaromonas sp.]
MALLNWFSGKSGARDDGDTRHPIAREKAPLPVVQRNAAESLARSEERKVRRHARREQVFVAVRESMTRAGVLSAMYKFKVLSLDQSGNQFLVMMDLGQASSNQPDKLGDIETAIKQLALARFEINVTSVYWRFDPQVAVGRPPAPLDAARRAALAASAGGGAAAAARAPARPYEPIHADEVAAFKQALAAASAAHPASVDRDGKVRSGPHSYTLLTGFEDTEMTESPTLPSLSTTQYGDLN